MNFNKHLKLEGKHAFLGASKYHWINYDDEKLANSYKNFLAIAMGSEYHDLAYKLIRLKEKLPRSNKTLNKYVNDAIGYKMTPEQIVYYSDNCFGTADAISFKSNLLRVHDLKTGTTKTSMHQLEIYTALFCLEYDYKPNDIDMELRIYQNDEVLVHVPEKEQIMYIMDKIIRSDKIIANIKRGGDGYV